MNYLAHIFLSGSNAHIQFGNFIGDAVKGSDYNRYPEEIRKGILLHRAIDHFADNHPLVKETVNLLRPHFGRYSAVLADIYFDHLLAVSFQEYASVSLSRFVYRFYGNVIFAYRFLPPRFKSFMWHFILTDRLGKYKTAQGIHDSLKIMAAYKRTNIDPRQAIVFMEDHREWLQRKFSLFFPELIEFSRLWIAGH